MWFAWIPSDRYSSGATGRVPLFSSMSWSSRFFVAPRSCFACCSKQTRAYNNIWRVYSNIHIGPFVKKNQTCICCVKTPYVPYNYHVSYSQINLEGFQGRCPTFHSNMFYSARSPIEHWTQIHSSAISRNMLIHFRCIHPPIHPHHVFIHVFTTSILISPHVFIHPSHPISPKSAGIPDGPARGFQCCGWSLSEFHHRTLQHLGDGNGHMGAWPMALGRIC